ncbi:hypothetical protein EV144_10463 [Flavobacterium sp. 270]|nr:hypothetical protein EV144_10463 [Flavobacterium sp. 270]
MKNNQNVVLSTPTVKLDFIEYRVLSQPKNIKKFSSNSIFSYPKMKLQNSVGNHTGNLFKDHFIFIIEDDLNVLILKNLLIWNQL